jgi:hypothetical protein
VVPRIKFVSSIFYTWDFFYIQKVSGTLFRGRINPIGKDRERLMWEDKSSVIGTAKKIN